MKCISLTCFEGAGREFLCYSSIISYVRSITKYLKEYAGVAIVNNQAVPNQFNDSAITETAVVIKNHLSSALQGCDLQGVMQMFSGNAGAAGLASSPLGANIIQQLAGSLGAKYVVDASAARGIASSLVPNMLEKLVHITADLNDSSIDMNQVVNQLTNGQVGNINFNDVLQNLISGLGGVDLGAIAGQVLGGNQSGLGGLLGNLIK